MNREQYGVVILMLAFAVITAGVVGAYFSTRAYDVEGTYFGLGIVSVGLFGLLAYLYMKWEDR